MIKNIQNWLDVRKQYKLEQQRQELINVAKVIISDIMRELVKYDIECSITIDKSKFTVYTLFHRDYVLDLFIDADCVNIYYNHDRDARNKIATYQHLKWYQLFKKSTKKKFYHAEDAVKAISNMIIMGEVEYQEKFGGNK